MALCTSYGNEVEESASFCTSCGKPMAASVQPSAAVSVTRPVCSSCGTQGDPDSVFCTECGKRLVTQPAAVAETVPAPMAAASASPAIAPVHGKPSPSAFCTSCGTRLAPGTGFCTNCGQPGTSNGSAVASATPTSAAPAPPAKQAASLSSVKADVSPTTAVPKPARSVPESTFAAPAPAPLEPPSVEQTRATIAAESPVEHDSVKTAPQFAAPVYAAPSDYPPAQPTTGAFRAIVLVLLLLVVVGVVGGWYFMGVETVIVCRPPDVTVFLDGKELPPTSFGKYVIPHLSRQPHLLRVQRTGFADTIQRLDFPLTSLHEWVNIKLVPHRPAR